MVRHCFRFTVLRRVLIPISVLTIIACFSYLWDEPLITERFRPQSVNPPKVLSLDQCRIELEKDQNEMDRVIREVNFTQENPVIIFAKGDTDLTLCTIPCRFETAKRPRQKTGLPYDTNMLVQTSEKTSGYSVIRNMESATNYHFLELEEAHKNNDIVMTTRLDSDIPVHYPFWVKNSFMSPPQYVHNPTALASAFISNCYASNFRLDAMRALQRNGISIDSYGRCENNKVTAEPKLDVIARYPFYLAFENSCEQDYVTEKYFQALEVGTVPIVIGAPNIVDFSPDGDKALIHIRKLEDVPAVAERMRKLLADRAAYKEMLEWKTKGPSDSFKALVDVSVVHSSCRLCIFAADKQRREQMKKSVGACPKCSSGDQDMIRLLIRERGLYEYKYMYLQGRNRTDFTLNQLLDTIDKTFTNEYRPIWTKGRDELPGSKVDQLKVFSVFPVGTTVRGALFGSDALWRRDSIADEESWQKYLFNGPCVPLEVIFV